jgi:hypothetical protein
MNILKGIVTELRERRLWPVAVALLIGLVAVPVLLTSSPAAAPASPTQGGGASGSTGKSVAVKLTDASPEGRLSARARNPFSQQGGTAQTLTSTRSSALATGASAGAGGTTVSLGAGSATSRSTLGSSSSSAGGSSSNAGPGASSGGSSGGSASVTSGGSSSTPAPSPAAAPPAHKKPAPTGLSATQSYAVAIQISNPSGGLNLIDPVERLSPIPSASQPLLVELGVEQGGRNVLFAVQPGSVVTGPGRCTPGPIDCEILSLSRDQRENVSTQSAGGATIAQFAVTGIYAQDHGSAGAATKARHTVNAVGAKLLTNSPLSALTLFQYQPSVGAVVDMRNLIVGGN